MAQTILVLMQFEFPDDRYVSYPQEHQTDIVNLYSSLPYFYSVIFSRKDEQDVLPLGGLLIKSDMAKDEAHFREALFEAIENLEPSRSCKLAGNSMHVTPVEISSPLVPTEMELNRIATQTHTLVGTKGNA